MEVCDDVSDVLNSPDSETISGRQSQSSTAESLQVPLNASVKFKQAQMKSASSTKSNKEIPDWAQKLAAMYNKPIEQVNFDNQIQKETNC